MVREAEQRDLDAILELYLLLLMKKTEICFGTLIRSICMR